MIEREPRFSWEDGVATIRRTAVLWVALALVATGAEAQETDVAQEAYFRAVGEFFDVPMSEMCLCPSSKSFASGAFPPTRSP